MSINKRNIDTDELSPASPGPIRPSGTGTHAEHRHAAERAAENPQQRGVEGRKAGPLPPSPNEVIEPYEGSGEAMTAEQAEHLRVLCAEAGEEFDERLDREAAERQIRRLQHRAGFKP